MVFSAFVVNSVFSTLEQRCLRQKDENCDNWWRWYRVQTYVCVGCLIEEIVWFLSLCVSLSEDLSNSQSAKTTCIEGFEEQEGREWRWKERHLGRKRREFTPTAWRDEKTGRGGERMCGGSSVLVPELISLSNIRYRPQTHTAIALLRSITWQVHFLHLHTHFSYTLIQYIRVCVGGRVYAHRILALSTEHKPRLGPSPLAAEGDPQRESLSLIRK